MHKILERAETPNGVKIQLEDWHMENTEEFPNLHGYTIGAYPIAKNGNWIIERNRPFRLTISFNSYTGYTDEMVLADYEKLKSGEITLEDLSERYWNRDKDKYFMGLIDTMPEW